MKNALKNFILLAIRLTGFLHIWRYLFRHDIVILMIHGVTDNDLASKWKPLRSYLSTKKFDKSLSILNKFYNFISLDEATAILKGEKPLKPHCLVVTFDDGYKNNLTQALPILEKHSIPAIIYLSTEHVNSQQPFWFDRLDYAIQQQEGKNINIRIKGKEFSIDTSNNKLFSKNFKFCLKKIKETASNDTEMLEEIKNETERLECASNRCLMNILDHDKWAAIITWADAKAVPKKLIDFGSHTVGHIRLGLVDENTVLRQLLDSKKAIEDNTGQDCHHFCYPDGNFNYLVSETTRSCGYLSAVTTIPGRNRKGDNLMTLKRIPFPNSASENEVLATISGCWPLGKFISNSLLKKLK